MVTILSNARKHRRRNENKTMAKKCQKINLNFYFQVYARQWQTVELGMAQTGIILLLLAELPLAISQFGKFFCNCNFSTLHSKLDLWSFNCILLWYALLLFLIFFGQVWNWLKKLVFSCQLRKKLKRRKQKKYHELFKNSSLFAIILWGESTCSVRCRW